MKILCCPNCHRALVVNVRGKNPQEVITCIHCGFSDYAYIFNLPQKRHFFHNNPNKMTVADVIQTVSQQLENIDLSYVNVEEFIYDLYGKHINTLLEYSKNKHNSLENETLFVKYEPEKVSLNDIYQKLNELQDSFLARVLIEDLSSVESTSVDIQNLKKEIQLRQRDTESWIKEYDSLLAKYQEVKEENETLKFLLQKQLK